MAQIHCYIPDEIAAQLSEKVEKNYVSISKYLAHLVKKIFFRIAGLGLVDWDADCRSRLLQLAPRY